MKNEEHSASDDQRTVLEPDQAALVFGLNRGMSMVMPKLPDDAPFPTIFRLIMAIAVRCNDPEWVAEMIEEGDRLIQQANDD